MSGLTLTSTQPTSVTILSNNFIDNYMCNANGEFVKIYLYLVRCTQQVPEHFSLRLIADKMNLTESDILRALRYWEQEGLLRLTTDGNMQVQSIVVTEPPVAASTATMTAATQEVVTPAVSASTTKVATVQPLVRRAEPEVIQELALIAEQYLKRQLTSMDLSKIAYFYEDLQFSPELIEYLLEHCVTNNNRSIRYIESVAISWADKGITTVEQAIAEGQHYRREYFAILKAFGISNRQPIDTEVEYMRKWLDEYHFTTEVISEACQRTITKTGNPVFAYADSILKNWKEQGILAKRDIAASDMAHHAKQQAKQIAAKENTRPVRSATKFSNFEQRGGYDFDQLEKQLNT